MQFIQIDWGEAKFNDTQESADFWTLPATWSDSVLYVTLDDNKLYRWTWSIYIEVSPSTWGSLTDWEIKIAYESNADTNAFTDAEQAEIQAIREMMTDSNEASGFIREQVATMWILEFSPNGTDVYKIDQNSNFTKNTSGNFANWTTFQTAATARNLCIYPAAASGGFDIYVEWIKYNETALQSISFADTDWLKYAYFTADWTNATLNWADVVSADYFQDKPITSVVYWNATLWDAVVFADERHWITMDWATHKYLHESQWTAYVNWMGINWLSNWSWTFTSIDSWLALDEDIWLAPDAQATAPFCYRAWALWTKTAADNLISLIEWGQAVWNENLWTDISPNYTNTQVTGNDRMIMFVFLTNDAEYPYVKIIGQTLYNNAGDAKDDIETAVGDLILTWLPSPEYVPVWAMLIDDNWDLDEFEAWVEYINITALSWGWTLGASWTTTLHANLTDKDTSWHPASIIDTDTTNFDWNLSATDDTVQKALETIDDLELWAAWNSFVLSENLSTWDIVSLINDWEIENVFQAWAPWAQPASTTLLWDWQAVVIWTDKILIAYLDAGQLPQAVVWTIVNNVITLWTPTEIRATQVFWLAVARSIDDEVLVMYIDAASWTTIYTRVLTVSWTTVSLSAAPEAAIAAPAFAVEWTALVTLSDSTIFATFGMIWVRWLVITIAWATQTHNPNYTHSFEWATTLSAKLIDTNKVAIAFWDVATNTNYANIYTVSWTVVSWWATTTISTTPSTIVTLCKLDTNKILFAYNSNSELFIMVATVTWTTISVNAPVSVSTTYFNEFKLAQFDTDSAVLTYWDASTALKLAPITVSWTVPTLWTEVALGWANDVSIMNEYATWIITLWVFNFISVATEYSLYLETLPAWVDTLWTPLWILQETWLATESKEVALLWSISTWHTWLTINADQYLQSDWSISEVESDILLWVAISATEIKTINNLAIKSSNWTILNIKRLTQAEYDLLTPVDTTLYIITTT